MAIRLNALLLAACVLAATPAWSAETYPARPVRLIVPFTPGGATDVVARLIGQKLSERLGQQFVIENRPGAGTNIGTEAVIRSTPDGYTLLVASPANAFNASLYPKLNFNFLREITPVAGIMRVPNVMNVTPTFPAKTVAEFISYARNNPGKVNMASSGIGTSLHLSGELFQAMAGVKLTHVVYRGSTQALTDIIAGQVDVIFDNITSGIGHIREGKIRPLAVTSTTRARVLPDVPTLAETLPGYEANAFYAIVAPPGTPPAIVEALNRSVNEALAEPVLKERLEDLGATLIPGSPTDLAAFLASETEKWGAVVRLSGAKVE
jgi:tripartite-type tricarboxylate transporter receptor subunit TctC